MDRAKVEGEIADVMAEADPGQEVVEVSERDHGEERNVDGVIKHQRRPGDQPREVPESAQGEVLPAARQRIG